MRSSVATFGDFRPASYADKVECDVSASSPSSRKVSPASARAERNIIDASMGVWYLNGYQRPVGARVPKRWTPVGPAQGGLVVALSRK